VLVFIKIRYLINAFIKYLRKLYCARVCFKRSLYKNTAVFSQSTMSLCRPLIWLVNEESTEGRYKVHYRFQHLTFPTFFLN